MPVVLCSSTFQWECMVGNTEASQRAIAFAASIAGDFTWVAGISIPSSGWLLPSGLRISSLISWISHPEDSDTDEKPGGWFESALWVTLDTS